MFVCSYVTIKTRTIRDSRAEVCIWGSKNKDSDGAETRWSCYEEVIACYWTYVHSRQETGDCRLQFRVIVGSFISKAAYVNQREKAMIGDDVSSLIEDWLQQARDLGLLSTTVCNKSRRQQKHVKCKLVGKSNIADNRQHPNTSRVVLFTNILFDDIIESDEFLEIDYDDELDTSKNQARTLKVISKTLPEFSGDLIE